MSTICHRIQNTLQKCQEINEEISSKSQINTLKFAPIEDLNALDRNHTCFGNQDIQMKTFSGKCEKSIIGIKAHFAKKYNMKGEKKDDCFIWGMAIISESEIFCSDQLNTSLKVFDYKEGKVTSTLQTSSFPADVTTTLYDEGKILFLNMQNGLSASHSLSQEKLLWNKSPQRYHVPSVFY